MCVIHIHADNLDEMRKECDGYLDDSRFKIISIGRLSTQKGFDMAIESAKILKNKGVKFGWYVLGDGPLKHQLEEQIRSCQVSDCFKLLVIRSNPYAYIKRADVFVMSSRFEGKSIALDEAKILCRPIVVTKYPSVYDAIEDGKNGILVDINSYSIAEGIEQLYNNKELSYNLSQQLSLEDNSNDIEVVKKFTSLVFL